MEFVQEVKRATDNFVWEGKMLVRKTGNLVFLIDKDNSGYRSFLLKEIQAYDWSSSEVLEFYKQAVSRFYVTINDCSVYKVNYYRESLAFCNVIDAHITGDTVETIYGKIENAKLVVKTRILYGCYLRDVRIYGYYLVNCYITGKSYLETCYIEGCVMDNVVTVKCHYISCGFPVRISRLISGNYYGKTSYTEIESGCTLHGPADEVKALTDTLEAQYEKKYIFVWMEDLRLDDGTIHREAKFIVRKKSIFDIVCGCSI